MTDERSPPSALKGRLAEVYVPALVAGTLEALAQRLGNRATIDDPLYGKASCIEAIDPLLAHIAAYFAQGEAVYTHVCTTTGIDRDASEGRVAMSIGGKPRELPIAVVAERRRLREIELRVYYAPPQAGGRTSRGPLVSTDNPAGLSTLISGIVDDLRSGAIEHALSGFEESGSIVDAAGARHNKQDRAMATFLAELGTIDVEVGGIADDGRTACVEAAVARHGRKAGPALLAFQRGESGLVNELRLYWE